MVHKILTTFCFCCCFTVLFSSATTPQVALHQADSLFKKKNYTEALFFYDSLFNQEKVYTPQMLTKLAFIEEGLGNYPKTLYYLNYLHYWHPRQDIATKMDELAAKHNLSGYTSSDIHLLYNYYSNYKAITISALITLTALLTALILFFKIRNKNTNQGLIVLTIVLIGGLFYLANFNPFPERAIVSKSNSLLMTEPSSASKLVDKVNEGNRVTVLGEKDDWYLIEYNDTTAFVKKGQLDVVK